MEYRAFGQTGLNLSVISLGGLLAHYEGVNGHPEPNVKRAIYLRALELGINVFDMGYGDEVHIPDELKGNGGAGLGTRFLGHVERCRLLVHLVDGTADDVAGAYATVRRELVSYGAGLEGKPEIVALNKCDALTRKATAEKRRALAAVTCGRVLTVSGVSGTGIKALLRQAYAAVAVCRTAERQAAEAKVPEDWAL